MDGDRRFGPKKRKYPSSNSKQQQKELRKREFTKAKKKWEIEAEESRDLKSRYDCIKPEDVKSFADFPLCKKTQKGLKAASYMSPTEIQRSTIGLALNGHDILGAAKTGSGKTLAFLIPMLECLFHERWTAEDGMGVLIISPTRELAYQTYEVLYKIGKQHEFSAGLVIGGKDVEEESSQISRTNVVICTPGRLLQHLDSTPNFECQNLKMLVLDEADRILDLGFKKTMNAIIDHLPTTRQTLLFSATQTKSVKDLARLSLNDPKYVAVHEHHEYSTPVQLEQSYIVCDLHRKLNILYSFIKAHRKKKILVFMSSCKQVKYTFEVFCKLRPGTTVMALYGTLNQLRRVSIYQEYCKKPAAVLFATDIAARGLDFPAVHWVVQADCPEDASTYIHRVGRTARYEKDGESLLFLLPNEEYPMVKQLNDRKIPIQKIEVNPNKKMVIYRKLQSYCAQEPEVKESAKRAFVSYIKSVYLMKDKEVFDVSKLPLEEYAVSLGLPFTPRVRFLEKRMKQQKANNGVIITDNGDARVLSEGSQDEIEGGIPEQSHGRVSGLDEEVDWRRDKRLRELEDLKPTNQEEEEEDDELLVKKEKGAEESSDDLDDWLEETAGSKKKSTKVALLKKKFKDGQTGSKIRFSSGKEGNGQSDDDGEDDDIRLNIEEAQEYMRAADKEDKAAYQERIKAKHKEERLKRKKAKEDSDDEEDAGDEEDDLGAQLELDGKYEPFDFSTLPKPMSSSGDEGTSGDDSDHDDDGDEYGADDGAIGSGSDDSDGSDDGSGGSGEGSEDSRQDGQINRNTQMKRKQPPRKQQKKLKKEKMPTDDKDDLTLEDNEQLALHILSGGR